MPAGKTSRSKKEESHCSLRLQWLFCLDKLGFFAQARERPKASPLGKLAKIFDF